MPPPCRSPSHAAITSEAIEFNGSNPITLDRITGTIIYADGSSGTCQRASKPVL